jgi:transposase, IS30 family
MALSKGRPNGVSTMPSQLTFAEREKISQMHYAKASDQEIAVVLGRSRSTIFREITKNSVDGTYAAVQAQALSEKRRSSRPLTRKMEQPDINARVRSDITKYWSPEQIDGRMKHEKLDAKNRVSRSTIERWICTDPNRKHWENFLRRRGKRRPKDDRRGQIPSTVSIAGRPAAAESRSRWETGKGIRLSAQVSVAALYSALTAAVAY